MLCISVGTDLGDDCHPDINCTDPFAECKFGECQCILPFVELEGTCGKWTYVNVDHYFRFAYLLKALSAETCFKS